MLQPNGNVGLTAEDLTALENGSSFQRALAHINENYGRSDETPTLQRGEAPSVRRYNWGLIVPELAAYGVPVDTDTLDLVLAGGAWLGPLTVRAARPAAHTHAHTTAPSSHTLASVVATHRPRHPRGATHRAACCHGTGRGRVRQRRGCGGR